MSFIKLLLIVLTVTGTGLLSEAQPKFSPPLQELPKVKVKSLPNTGIPAENDSPVVRIIVQVPPDHHGYLDQGDEGLLIPFAFNFSQLISQGIRVTEIERPSGVRDEQSHATVLRGRGQFKFLLDTLPSSFPSNSEFSTKMRYQICNDVTNVCYPPRTIEVPLHLATVRTLTSTPKTFATQPITATTASTTLLERVTRLFHQSTQNLPFTVILVFLAGLIAAATPCVYPIIPITSAIVMARGGHSRQQGQLHAIIYFVGLVVFYTALGAFAATTGTALSAVMTNAWVNITFALLFAYLGLSMLGLYDFQFLTILTAKLGDASSRRNGIAGTFFMGLTAGLVVSPCIGPVVGAILLNISGQAATITVHGGGPTAGIVVHGLVLMTSFGTGLGLPFLVVGLMSNRLPQSGGWLTKVKFLLGVPILYFAYTYYVKGMETLNVFPNIAHAMLIGVVAIIIAVCIGALHALGQQPQRHLALRQACSIVLLIIGVHFLYNGLGQSGILIASPPTNTPEQITTRGSADTLISTTNPPPIEIHGNLRWFRDITLARQQARTAVKPLFVDFYATWCANCKAFSKLTQSDMALNTALQSVVLAKVYDTDKDFQAFQADQRLPELRGVGNQPFLPLFVIYSAQGEFVWKGQDYQAVHTILAQLQRAWYASTQ